MKRIITCSDGTWNSPGTTQDRSIPGQQSGRKAAPVKDLRTNVERLFTCICASDEKGNAQIKAYDAGVGTGYTLRDRLLGGITGAGIDQNIMDMYTFILMNYEPGDELYLFGFSRGAYTARSIAGFIRNCGILKPAYLHLIRTAFELYRDRNKYTSPDSDMMKSFRQKYSYDPPTIKFIGVWDTVGALGIPLPWFGKRYQFHDYKLSSKIGFAYHALAVDDKRVLFSPTLWQLSDTVKSSSHHQQVMEQRWFAGVHSNIGGGYEDCSLSNLALKWMMEKAAATGLCYHPVELAKIEGKCTGKLYNSYTPAYWLWAAKDRTIRLNDGDTNQTIDDSVWERWNSVSSYRPKNLHSLKPDII